MALAASSPALEVDQINALNEADDEEIARVRAEIQALSQRHSLLRSSILSSTRAQAWLKERQEAESSDEATQDDLPLLLASSRQTSKTNVHRLALGVTSFPFTDPSPECQALNPLLGVRFDICQQDGRYTKPFYLFCRRISASSQELRIHRHTIPPLVPLQDYEKKYLPLVDEGYGGSEDSFSHGDNSASRTQDLHALVKCVRRDLVAWKLRVDAIELVRDHLGLPHPKSHTGNGKSTGDGGEAETETTEDDQISDEDFESSGKFGVRQLESGNKDASQVRILWTDDRVGRLVLSPDGAILKVVILNGEGRLAEQERIISSNSATIYVLSKRLETLHNTIQHST
ncbi:hypothetical protein LTR84_007423 [Exophiala bonariae]|uniref:Cenp-O kinetochore centromere component n=1 Tax=Exophiala bonariae TaxID=1690606 RepID=A0AAV9MYG8_9EURO|nr:hypothetical protein LTR84_007423 [Exophiala bonariae]